MGTLVARPAVGRALLGDFLTVSDVTVIVDHGQGLLNLLCHLDRIDVPAGPWIEKPDMTSRRTR